MNFFNATYTYMFGYQSIGQCVMPMTLNAVYFAINTKEFIHFNKSLLMCMQSFEAVKQ